MSKLFTQLSAIRAGLRPLSAGLFKGVMSRLTSAFRLLTRNFQLKKLPTSRETHRSQRPVYLLLRLAHESVWLLRLVSPAAWFHAFFQREEGGKHYTIPSATEGYQLAVTALPIIVLLLTPAFVAAHALLAWTCILLGVESIQYQFRTVVIRPAVDRAYKMYSAPRTLLILLLQYIQLVFIYAVIYVTFCSDQFGGHLLSRVSALEFSAMIMTTVGNASITADAGSLASFVSATQGLFGVFLFSLMIGTTISRMRAVEEVGNDRS